MINRLFGYAKPYTMYFVAILIMMFITTVATLMRPIITGNLVDLFVAVANDPTSNISDSLGILMQQAGLFMVLLVVTFIFLYLQTLLLQQVGQKIIKRIRMDIYTKMLSLPTRYYNENPVGALLTRVTNDTESLNEMYTNVITSVFKNGMYIIGILVMMFSINVKITLCVLAIVPVVILMTMIFQKYSRKAYRATRTYLTQMNVFLSEHIMGMSLIQMFNRQDKTLNRMKNINADLLDAGLKEQASFMVYRPSLFAVSNLTIVLVLYLGSKEVLAGTISVGTIVIIATYVKDFFTPIEQLADVFNILQSAIAAGEKIFTVLDEENEIEVMSRPVC